MSKEKTHAELKEFVIWYFDNFDLRETYPSVIETCMCGHFHIGRREAKEYLNRCLFLRYLRRRGSVMLPGGALRAKPSPTP